MISLHLSATHSLHLKLNVWLSVWCIQQTKHDAGRLPPAHHHLHYCWRNMFMTTTTLERLITIKITTTRTTIIVVIITLCSSYIVLMLKGPNCTIRLTELRQQLCWWWTAAAKLVDLPDKCFSLEAVKGHNSVDQPHVEGLFSIVHACQEPHLSGPFLTCTASLLKHIIEGSTDKGKRRPQRVRISYGM